MAFVKEDDLYQNYIKHVTHKENGAPEEHRASHVKQIIILVPSHLPK
jgi:hypothetical protein